MLAAAIAVAVALAACGGGTDEAGDNGKRLPVVVRLRDETLNAKTVHVTGEATSMRMPKYRTHIEGDLDFENDRGAMSTSATGQPQAFRFAWVVSGDDVYDNVDGFRFLLGMTESLDGYEWLRIAVPRSGSGLSFMEAVDPFAIVDTIARSEIVTGPEPATIDGAAMQKYRVRLSEDDISSATGVSVDSMTAKERLVDLWVDGHDRLRRWENTQFGMTHRFDFTRYGEPVDIDVPHGDAVYDAGTVFDTNPDYDHLAGWEEVATSTDGPTWSVWHARAGDGWGCWNLEVPGEANGVVSGSIMFPKDAKPKTDPEHDGSSGACELEPGPEVFAHPILPLTEVGATIDGTRVFVGVAADGIDHATVTTSGGGTHDVDVGDDHVVVWTGEKVERVDAELDGLPVVCEPADGPQLTDAALPEGVQPVKHAPFACYARRHP
jgi:hypothetical protein